MPIVANSATPPITVDTEGAILAAAPLAYLDTRDNGADTTARNMADAELGGLYTEAGVEYKRDLVAVAGRDAVKFDGVSGYLALHPETLPAGNSPFAIMMSFGTLGPRAYDVNLFDITDDESHLKLYIPANNAQLALAFNAVAITGPAVPGILSKANTVLVVGDGVGRISVYLNGSLYMSALYTPVAWTPTRGLVAATFDVTGPGESEGTFVYGITGFSEVTVSGIAVFDTALSKETIQNILGVRTVAVPPTVCTPVHVPVLTGNIDSSNLGPFTFETDVDVASVLVVSDGKILDNPESQIASMIAGGGLITLTLAIGHAPSDTLTLLYNTVA